MDRIAFIDNEVFYYWSQIILVLAAVTAISFFLSFYLRKSGNGLAAVITVPLCIALSLFLARFMHWYCRSDSYAGMSAALTDYSSGGYALMGVFGGCLLAACIVRLLGISKNLPEMLDTMSLAGAAGIAVGRLQSLFNTSDRGVLIEGITNLPIVYPVNNAVTGVTEYRLATFMLQAIVTGVIFVVLAIFYLKNTSEKAKYPVRDGDICLLFFTIYGAAQVVLDSTRYDSLFMRSNGFISIVQILGAVGIAVAIGVFSTRMVKAMRFRVWHIAIWLALAASIGGAAYMEYHVQRHGDQALFAYTVMSACLCATIFFIVLIRLLAVHNERKSKT